MLKPFFTVDTAVGLTIVVAQTFSWSFTSTSSFRISPKHVGCAGQSFSGCHKNFGPLNHCCCSVNVLVCNPHKASSAGFFCVLTYLHWLGSRETLVLGSIFNLEVPWLSFHKVHGHRLLFRLYVLALLLICVMLYLVHPVGHIHMKSLALTCSHCLDTQA